MAVAFLTVLPIHGRDLPSSAVIARSRFWYPAVGLLLGGLLASGAAVAAWLTSSALGAFLVLLAWVLITGALHLDGLCDLCDGLCGGSTAGERLRIMKDPHVGMFGLVASVLVLLGKFATLESLLATSKGLWLLGAAVVLARCLVLCMAAGSRYPRPEGTGKVLIEATPAREGWLFAGVGALLTAAAAFLGGCAETSTSCAGHLLLAGISFAAALLGVTGLKSLCRRRLGGVTGDCLGAAIEVAESSFLLAGVVLAPWLVPAR